MTESDQPLFSPAAFELMSALVLTSSVTHDELAAHSRQSSAVLQDTLQLLTENGYAAVAAGPPSSGPAYCATAKGRSAFFEQIAWLNRRITDKE